MNRRTALKLMAGSAAVAMTGASGPQNFGWLGPVGTTTRTFSARAPHLKKTGTGKRVLLWDHYKLATGRLLAPYEQEIGDCVGVSFAKAVDVLTAVQSIITGREIYAGDASSEVIYAGSRIEIADGKFGVGDGSNGEFAVRWLKEYGVVLRKRYSEFDLTNYSGQRARDWGHRCHTCTPWGGGVPDELETVAKAHPVRDHALMQGWEDVRDSITNGYPVVLCSTVGFGKTFPVERDQDGFLSPTSQWNHAMVCVGVDDGRRPGACALNSFGTDWVIGPTRYGQPLGSFWVDAKVIDRMCKSKDCYSISNYLGYPLINL